MNTHADARSPRVPGSPRQQLLATAEEYVHQVRRRQRHHGVCRSHEGPWWPDCPGWAKIFNFKNAIAIWSSWFLEFGWKLQSSYADVGISNAIVFSSLSAVKHLVETHPL